MHSLTHSQRKTNEIENVIYKYVRKNLNMKIIYANVLLDRIYLWSGLESIMTVLIVCTKHISKYPTGLVLFMCYGF